MLPRILFIVKPTKQTKMPAPPEQQQQQAQTSGSSGGGGGGASSASAAQGGVGGPWARMVMEKAAGDGRDQPWKRTFKDHDRNEVAEDWCNLMLPHNVQGNNMAA